MKNLPGTLELRDLVMTLEAGVHRIGTHKPGILRRVRIMTAQAVFLRSLMLDGRALYLIGCLLVAFGAKLFGIGFGQNYFVILGRQVALGARFVGIRHVREPLGQLGSIGLMDGVTAEAIGLFKQLS
jgi:hypothetical protein